MTVREFLKVIDSETMVQILPANEEVCVYKPHNNQFTDPASCFLKGNGIEIDNMIIARVEISGDIQKTSNEIKYLPCIDIWVTIK